MPIRNLGVCLVLLTLAACGGSAGIKDQGCLYGYCFVETRTADRGSGPIVVGQVAIPMEGQNNNRPIVASGAGESFVQGFFKGTGPALALGGFAAVAAAQADPDHTEITQEGGGASVDDVSASAEGGEANASAEGGDATSGSISGAVANAGVINQNRIAAQTPQKKKKSKRVGGTGGGTARIVQSGTVTRGCASSSWC